MQATIFILLTWILLIPIFGGIGALAARVCRIDLHQPERWFMAFWAGWGITIAFLQIWHFVFPVNDAARLILIGFGLLGLAWNRRSLVGAWRAMSLHSIALILCLLLFGFWLANRSITTPIIFDTGLYHLQTVKWSSTYPAVPGLGLVHSRLAHGTGFFLYAALLDTGYWFERTYHIANGVTYWVLFSQLIISGTVIFRQKPYNAYHVMNLLFAMVILRWILADRTVPGVSNDPSVNALGVLLASQVMYLIEHRHLSVRDLHYRVGVIVLLASVGVAIKFSFVALGGGLSLLALVILLTRLDVGMQRAASLRRYAESVGLYVLIAACVFIPMMARSVILTGYALYPGGYGALPVAWRLSKEVAVEEARIIQWWVRDQTRPVDEVLSSWDWVAPWFEHVTQQQFSFRIPLMLLVLSICVLLIVQISTRTRRRLLRVSVFQWWLLAVAIVAIVFWFFSVPDLRFLGAGFWILCIGICTILLSRIPQVRARNYVVAVAFLLVSLDPVFVFLGKLWNPPGSDQGLYILEEAKVDPFTTQSGLVLWVPQEGDQCWNAPLPCTPYPNPNVRLRVEGDISQGFIEN